MSAPCSIRQQKDQNHFSIRFFLTAIWQFMSPSAEGGAAHTRVSSEDYLNECKQCNTHLWQKSIFKLNINYWSCVLCHEGKGHAVQHLTLLLLFFKRQRTVWPPKCLWQNPITGHKKDGTQVSANIHRMECTICAENSAKCKLLNVLRGLCWWRLLSCLVWPEGCLCDLGEVRSSFLRAADPSNPASPCPPQTAGPARIYRPSLEWDLRINLNLFQTCSFNI